MKSTNKFVNITLIVLAMIGVVLMTSCTKDEITLPDAGVKCIKVNINSAN